MAETERKKEINHGGMWKQVFGRLLKNKWAVFGLCGMIFFIVVSILAPVLTPYGLNDLDFTNMKSPPSWKHLLGTDLLGRDYLTRLLYAGRYSLSLGLIGSLMSCVIGITFGSIAGYFGGWLDTVIMRITDIVMAIPPMLFTIVLSMVLGSGYFVTILALGLSSCTGSLRMTRGQILRERKLEYLEAARTINCSTPRIIIRHILPNVLSPLILGFTMGIGGMIQGAAGLSIIGLGVQPPTPEWGQMLSDGLSYVNSYPYLILFPGIIIFLVTLFMNLFGDGMRDAIDPKMKR